MQQYNYDDDGNDLKDDPRGNEIKLHNFINNTNTNGIGLTTNNMNTMDDTNNNNNSNSEC